MPVPTIFILPICTSIAQNIGNETYLENRIHIQYIDFIVLVLILISIISFTLWIRPLYYYTPIFLESSIPSRLIPDDHFINFLLAKNFVIFLSLLLSSKLASIFFTIFSCFLNTLLYVDIFKVPFISPFDSAVAMSGLFVNTISTIFSCISIYFPIVFEYQDIFFYSSIPFFIIISLISYFVRNKIELKDPLCKCQQSVWKSTVDKENIDELEAEYVKYGNINDLLASIYCKLILKENDIKTLKQILNLMKGNTFSWPIKFVLFEFYKQCNQDKFSIDNDPQITEIKNEIFAYQDKIDLFWSNIIKGTLLEASQVNILLKKEQEQIRKKYWKLIRIYSQNVDLNSLGSKYLFLKNNDINNEIDLISRYKMFCSTKNIVDTMYYPTGSTTESSYETETDQQKKKVSQNIYRYAINQNLPFIDYVFLILSIILLLISFMLVSIPFQRLIQRASQFKNLPESIGKEVSIGADWGVLDYSLSHAISCTKYVDADHDDIIDLINGHHKPEHLSHVTIGHTVRLIDQIAINLMKNTVQFPNDIRTIAAQDILDYLEQIWLKPTVALYPHSSLIPLRQFRIDTISMINGYCGIVIKNFDGTVHPCQNPSVKEVKMIERDFYANSYTMKEIIMLCMDSSNQYVQKLLDINLTNHDFKFIAIYFLPFILTIFISTFLYFASFYGEYSLVKKYFRPSSHPNENIQVDFCQANEKFKLTHQYFTFSSFLIFMFIFTFLQMYLLLNYTNGAYRNVMNYCIFLSNLGNYSLNSITMLTGFIRRIQYPKNISLHRNLPRYYKGMELTLDHVYTSMIDISHTKSLKFLFDEYCDYHRFNSFHDSISCWSILRVMDLMNYWSNIHVLDTSSFCFDQIQHLIVSHGLPEIRRAITNTARIATLEITKVGFYAFLEILFLAFIGSFVIIVIVIYFLDINGRYAHIVSYLYFLNPAYVTKNRCFIDFLVNLDSKQTQEKYSQSYLKIFNSTNISLLILDRNLNILVGTASFFKDFGYQQQQLCGQSIDIIIPRHFQESNNNEKFYTNLNKIINKNSYIKKYSKWVIGRCNDNSQIHLIANVETVAIHNKRYFVIEFKSMSDELSFEDLIISHNELYNEFYITSMPVSVFGVNFIKTPKICSFKDSVALYLITDFIEEEYRHYEDFNQFKAIQTLSVPLFCGDFNSLVISSTCTHLLIIFFTNNDDNSHITNAIDFGSKFWDINPYNKTGAMFSCGPMKAILYPPPILEKGESNESHTPSVNSKFFEETSNTNEPSENDSLGKDKNNENDKNNGHYRSFGFDDKFKSPSMTVEPLVKNLQYLPKIAKLMKTNSLIVSTQFLSCLSDYEAYDLPNDFGLDLSIISLEDSPISQINEDVQNQIYDTALPDDYFNDDQNILVDDEEFQL